MFNIFDFWKFLFCAVWMPLYFNGSKKSQTSSATSNNYDNRQVNTDSNNTTMAWDYSQGSHNTILTDGGAIAGMTDTAKAAIAAALAQSNSAYDHADSLFAGALDFANRTGGRELEAFDRAATIQEGALSAVKAANAGATSLVQAAYADAKGTTDSQKQIMFGVLAVAGVAVLSVMKAKG